MIAIAVRDGRFSQRSTWSARRVPRKGDTIRANGYSIRVDKKTTVKGVNASSDIIGSRQGGSVIVKRHEFKCDRIVGPGPLAVSQSAAVICFRGSRVIANRIEQGR